MGCTIKELHICYVNFSIDRNLETHTSSCLEACHPLATLKVVNMDHAVLLKHKNHVSKVQWFGIRTRMSGKHEKQTCPPVARCLPQGSISNCTLWLVVSHDLYNLIKGFHTHKMVRVWQKSEEYDSYKIRQINPSIPLPKSKKLIVLILSNMLNFGSKLECV